MTHRGRFIVFEGIDRAGKTTQAQMLVDALTTAGRDVVFEHYPDRTTPIGQLINKHLTSSSDDNEFDARAMHLLFSANRWECAERIRRAIADGKVVICDRYTYSGAAYTMAKGVVASFWCLSTDEGLPEPDKVFLLTMDVMEATKRGQYGTERYEHVDFQRRVANAFEWIATMKEDGDGGHNQRIVRVDADQPKSNIHRYILSHITDVFE